MAQRSTLLSPLDPATIRPRFPALDRQQNGARVLFFDNPAGTQVPQETIDGYVAYLSRSNANLGGLFVTSQETDALLAEARAAMADLLNAAPGEIVFGPNMTTLTFALRHALARTLRPGDEVVTTRLEHDANVAPWLSLREQGVVIRFVDIHAEDLTLDLRSAEEVISDRTRLVAVGYASNAFGTINDVRQVVEMAHARGAWVFVDAVHYGPHGSIDVQELGCDLLVCSSYKFFGPHLGFLYGRRDLLDSLRSYHVRPAGNVTPGKWETGTQNHEALGGLLGTIAYLQSLSSGGGDRRARLREALTRIRSYERTLSERLIRGMQSVPGLRVYGITEPAAFDRRVPTVSFTVAGRKPAEVAGALGSRGIFSWAGNHYAVEPLARLGIEATNRIGLVHYNTAEEIDVFLETLEHIARG